MRSEYAKAGVDYTKIEPFKQKMIGVAKRTANFPSQRGITINTKLLHAHGGVWDVDPKHYIEGYSIAQTKEGLGNKNWIAEWMYLFSGTGNTYHHGIGIDTVRMATNDLIAQGALAVTYSDEVAAGDSEWYADKKRAHDLGESFFEALKVAKVALVSGESSSLKYLVRAQAPVASAPVFSGCAMGIIPRHRLLTGKNLKAGDMIIALASSGVHANGISLIIKKALELKKQFLTVLTKAKGNTLGDEALIPTACYVGFMEKLLDELQADEEVHAVCPGTGGGVSKIAFDSRPFTYRIFKDTWLPIPPLCQVMLELGVPIKDCLTTFNWGAGYYVFARKECAQKVCNIAANTGHVSSIVGVVENGPRTVIFGPENNLVLPPPGD